MKAFFQRMTVRATIAVAVPVIMIAWTLATPYACIDGAYSRRDHFRDGRDMFSLEGWRSYGHALWSGQYR